MGARQWDTAHGNLAARYSAAVGQPGRRLRGAAVRRLSDLRCAHQLGFAQRQQRGTDTRARDGVGDRSGGPQALDRQAAVRCRVSRWRAFRRRRRGVEFRRGAQQQGSAVRCRSCRYDALAHAERRAGGEDRFRDHRRDHRDAGRDDSLPAFLPADDEPEPARRARQRLGKIRGPAFRHRTVPRHPARAADEARPGAQRRLLGRKPAPTRGGHDVVADTGSHLAGRGAPGRAG